MDWIFVAVVLNSIVAAGFPSEEACLGKKAMFEKEHKIFGACFRMPTNNYSMGTTIISPGGLTLCGDTNCAVNAGH